MYMSTNVTITTTITNSTSIKLVTEWYCLFGCYKMYKQFLNKGWSGMVALHPCPEFPSTAWGPDCPRDAPRFAPRSTPIGERTSRCNAVNAAYRCPGGAFRYSRPFPAKRERLSTPVARIPSTADWRGSRAKSCHPDRGGSWVISVTDRDR